ncbi:hypothetical protein INS49_010401 [Diaporthe citri]|uniref:uncharacterized protein n=1 Tax=Diaporthe citri TaxID=83186 RepID=UPI001C822550|nr:uncharacterized protein INS49_010401 [Diaporthe citri]KAG6362171.1 hypothetical protein INS49_010401 [Diaporthe citri]
MTAVVGMMDPGSQSHLPPVHRHALSCLLGLFTFRGTSPALETRCNLSQQDVVVVSDEGLDMCPIFSQVHTIGDVRIVTDVLLRYKNCSRKDLAWAR